MPIYKQQSCPYRKWSNYVYTKDF